ncbi:sensor histidine kinase [Actinomadura madurae]|uniref:sensor histidine kinase n=1 Tax=Actinomadura madurae TaxID=1993 RepID=UPI000D9B2FB9|nr:histidine kinase [Actinomadura madurae]SPT63846.1 Nitrate/nitrite sensor protein narX [Actinomadura madurae]
MRCSQISPLVARARSLRADVVREAREARAAVRSAPRHVVAGELAMSLTALALGFLPLWASPPSPGLVAATAASACWAALLVPARRRWPAATLVATAPVLGGTNVGAIAVLPVIAYSTARRIRPARRLWTMVLVTAGAGLPLSVALEMSSSVGLGEALAGYVLSAAFLLPLPAWSGSLMGQRRPLVRLLRERNEYLERAQALSGEKARMKERARIATEMHDMLGHRLTLISIHTGALEITMAEKAPEVSDQAVVLRTTAATAMAELREILGVLRDPMEGATETAGEHKGTRTDIADLVTESRRAGIDVDLAWAGEDLGDADPRTRQAVHRVVREGLTNVHKHAPATRTRVEVANDAGRVRVRVINGPVRGTPQRGPGTRQGLVGLDERIALLHGALTAGPTPEGGFVVAADLPLRPPVPMPGDPAMLRDVPEPPKPLDGEVLTMPRALGAGCLGLLVLVPVVLGTAALIVARALE